jgi:hypothetical protein
MTSPTHQQLIGLLERAGSDTALRRLLRVLRSPIPQLEELDELIAGLGGPDIAARVVVEVYRGGMGG